MRILRGKHHLATAAAVVFAAACLLMPAPGAAQRVHLGQPAGHVGGFGGNILYLEQIGDWQVGCYAREIVEPVPNICELRFRVRDFASGHIDPIYSFDLVIEPTAPADGRRDLDYIVLLQATPSAGWEGAQIRVGELHLDLSEGCNAGPCILRRGPAMALLDRMVAGQGTASVSYRDAPLTGSGTRRRVSIPLVNFERAIGTLISQTQRFAAGR